MAYGDVGLLEAFEAWELLPLVEGGALRVVGGDPDEERGELELVIEGFGDPNALEGTQYLLKVRRDEDLAPGEGPQKYNVETDAWAGGAPAGDRWEEGFDTADEAIAWIEKVGSRPDEKDDGARPLTPLEEAIRHAEAVDAILDEPAADLASATGKPPGDPGAAKPKNASAGAAALALPSGAVRLPDNKQWVNRFEIESESSGRVYTIAQNRKKGHWGCSCPAWRTRRMCKHLKALGLPEMEEPSPITALGPEGSPPAAEEPPPSSPTALTLPRGAVKLPDNKQWTNRFEIKSESSGRVYIVAQNKAKGHWGCSCPSWRTRRTCKHLKALGLPELEEPSPIAVMAGRIAGRAKDQKV
jgi:hypothetical protein